jgi:hypothetical protein
MMASPYQQISTQQQVARPLLPLLLHGCEAPAPACHAASA